MCYQLNWFIEFWEKNFKCLVINSFEVRSNLKIIIEVIFCADIQEDSFLI